MILISASIGDLGNQLRNRENLFHDAVVHCDNVLISLDKLLSAHNQHSAFRQSRSQYLGETCEFSRIGTFHRVLCLGSTRHVFESL